MLTLDEAQVEALLPSIDLPALMRETLVAVARGEGGGPVRAVVPASPEMWFAAMPAVVHTPLAALGAKLVIAAPALAARGLPTHRAVVVLFDLETGAPRTWVEAEAITRDRTAAVSVVATAALAARPRGRHAILGAGVQGEAHVRAFARAGMLGELVLWSRTRARSELLADRIRTSGMRITVADSADDAVRGADVISTCTASAVPLFKAAGIAAGAHLNAVGACVPQRRELPGALLGVAALVLDDLEAARRESGDVLLAVAEGEASWDGAVTLGDVLAGRARPRPARVSVFVSLGLGVEDVATAAALVMKAESG